MKRYSPNFFLISIALLMLSMGVRTDDYLRANVGLNCFGCTTFACKIVTLADEPSIFFQNPVEVIRDFF